MSAHTNDDGRDDSRTVPAASRRTGSEPIRRAVLRLADGASVPLLTAVVLGRDPARPDHVPVRLDDPSYSASRSHVTIVQRDELVEVTDLASTNGTSVSFGLGEVLLRPHEPTLVTVPCIIICGDCRADVSFNS